MTSESSHLRTALFIDFDNIFLGLRDRAEEDAEVFATQPGRWLAWLERELERLDVAGGGEAGRQRRILVRRCYLNPRAFNRYRPFFIRSAFEVVDCPPLTSQGKTSADITMALDVMDALNFSTRFDEFIIFSGDADFTPVLLRLRKHDRETAVLAVGPSSAAYEAAADRVVSTDRFLEEGIGSLAPHRPIRELDDVSEDLLAQIAQRLEELVAMTGGLSAAHLPEIYKEFAEFTSTSNWLGFWSLRAMTEAIVAHADELVLVEDEPWWLARRGMLEPDDGDEGPEAAQAAEASSGRPAGRPDSPVSRFVRDTLTESDEPLLLATLAQLLVEEFGEDVRAHNWQGHGSFKSFLEMLRLDGLTLSDVMPGFIYDPRRHELPDAERRDAVAEDHPELVDLVREISDLTDMPYLSPEQYAVLAQEIAREITAAGFALTRTSKAVRDRMSERGVPIARSQVSFVLKGLLYSGYSFEEGAVEEPREIAEALYRNVLILAERAERVLDDAEQELLEDWIVGGIDDLEALEASGQGASLRIPEDAAGDETEGNDPWPGSRVASG